jgi:hypothetical protein
VFDPNDREEEEPAQASLLRDIFRPFRTVISEQPWLTAPVMSLAQAAYDERNLPAGTLDPGRVAVLADALEEAACSDEEILRHLREPAGVHVRGCLALDVILGKK